MIQQLIITKAGFHISIESQSVPDNVLSRGFIFVDMYVFVMIIGFQTKVILFRMAASVTFETNTSLLEKNSGMDSSATCNEVRER